MNREELIQTAWAIRIKDRCSPAIYQEAIARALQSDFKVKIVYDNGIGKWTWAVIETKSDFWLEIFNTLPEAKTFCEQMGWQYG